MGSMKNIENLLNEEHYIEKSNFSENESTNLCVTGKTMKISSQIDLDDELMIDGVLDEAIDVDVTCEEDEPSCVDSVAPLNSMKEEIISSLRDLIWPEIVSNLRPLIEKVVLLAKKHKIDANITDEVDEAEEDSFNGYESF